jgi:hypothetical protein
MFWGKKKKETVHLITFNCDQTDIIRKYKKEKGTGIERDKPVSTCQK